jgi:hypothetical protein
MKFTETTGTPITQLKQFESIYDYSNCANIIPLEGELCQIKVKKGTTLIEGFPLPEGAESLSQDGYYLKVGNGTNPIKELPWITTPFLNQYKVYTYPEGATEVPYEGEIC